MEEEIKSVFMTKPVFDVYSISIQPTENEGCPNPFSDGKLCRIYGSVKVCDESQSVYHLYNRKDDDPEIIKLGGSISLMGFPVICSKILTLSIYLYDIAHEAEISNGTLVLNYSGEYPYEQFQCSEVKGEYGFAKVRHATFQHAVVADVEEVSIMKEDGGSSDLYGSVVASLVGDGGIECASTLLFSNEQKDEECKSVVAKFNTPFQLYQACVAVPVLCKLRIKIDFCDENGSRITKIISPHTRHRHIYYESVIDQNWEIKVGLRWPSCTMKFLRERQVADQVNAKQVFRQDLKAINISLPSEPPKGFFRSQTTCAKFSSLCFAEVFSVLVCFDSDVIDIKGTITLNSSGKAWHIFSGCDKLSSERKTLAIQCPPSLFEIKDESLSIDVDLKDGEDHVVGKGICSWVEAPMEFYFDRHLCIVFKGDVAYTVVHASLLRWSVQARVVVSFIQKDTQVPETEVNVYGSITAGYGSYEYSTPYVQQNYKYKLFSRPEDDCTLVELGSTLELSKSLLPVPREETLILDVDLKVGQGVDQKFEALKQVVEFEHRKSNIFAVEKGNYTVFMWVEWSDGRHPRPLTYPDFYDTRLLRKMMPNIASTKQS